MVSLPKTSYSLTPSGFTLVELVVAVAILGILVTIPLATFSILTGQTNLNTESQKVVSALQLAKNQTLASENESQFGVHFETTQYVVFQGTTYVSTDPNNKVFSLNGTEIYEINIAGGSDVIFDRIRGTTSNGGNVKIRLTSDTSKTKTIVVNSLGQASLQETVTPSGTTRVTDTRHLHFDLGWSIQGLSPNLRFDFTEDGVMEDIPMAGFFNVGQTEFSWGGTIVVNGANQVLRVHTHNLNATDTILSVHRDRLKNDKAVDILIDGKKIVSYTATGTATTGNSGGTMTVQ